MTRAANAIATGLLLLAFGAGVLLYLLPGADSSRHASVFSKGPSGRSVAFELLREFDFKTEAWTSAPAALPETPSLLVMHGVPKAPLDYASGADGADVKQPIGARRSGRRRDPTHYRRFIEAGGTLLVPLSESMFDFLRDDLELDELEDVDTFEVETSLGSITVELSDGETFEIDWTPSSRLIVLRTAANFDVKLEDSRGDSLGIYVPLGKGGIYLLASGDGFLDNRRFDEVGNALLLVRIAEEYALDRRVLFDEYALGGWTPESPLELALTPANFPLSLHLALLLALLVWRAAWASQFPRDPVPFNPVSATMRARGFAGVLTRAGRWDSLARMLTFGVFRRLAQRAGHRMEFADSDPATVRKVLARLLTTSGEQAVERATRMLTRSDVSSRDELEDLGESLVRLERAVHRTTNRKADD